MSQMSIFKPIEISYKWDLENFTKAFENSYTHQFKNSARRYIGWLFIVMAQFGVVMALKGGAIGLLMLSTILIFYWYYAKKWLIKRRLLKEFNSSNLRDSTIKLTVTQDGIKQDENFVSWEQIQGVVPIDKDILLYYLGKAFYIPSSAFKSLEDKNRLKELAKKRGRYFEN